MFVKGQLKFLGSIKLFFDPHLELHLLSRTGVHTFLFADTLADQITLQSLTAGLTTRGIATREKHSRKSNTKETELTGSVHPGSPQ